MRKITESSVGGVYTSMEQAVRGIASLVSTAPENPPSGDKLSTESLDQDAL
jgi:hypothetical protein